MLPMSHKRWDNLIKKKHWLQAIEQGKIGFESSSLNPW